jgi:DNA end-binding protein Ku
MPAIVWKGYISFGLVSFPVRLFSAARAQGVHFHLLHREDLSRVKEVWYCVQQDKTIDRTEMVKGYETGKGKYIVIEDEELKSIAPATADTMEILQFVREAEVDPIFFERSYYVTPGDDLSKPYVLFVKALRETKYSAIAKLTMHGREHAVIIRSAEGQLLLHTLFYAEELHRANQPAVSPKSDSTRQELELATQLIQHLAGPFKPEAYHDTYRENVEKLIAQKKKGEKVTAESKPRRMAPVVDLMEALKKSLRNSESAGKVPKKGGSVRSGSKTARRRDVA